MPTHRRAPAVARTAEQMRSHAEEAARLLRTLGHEARLLVLCSLVDGERSVGELNAGLDMSQPALSQQLAVLREQGLVQTRRDAQTIYYSLTEGPARALLDTLHGIYCGTAGKRG